MKKWIAWILVFALLMTLSGCFSSPVEETTQPTDAPDVSDMEDSTITETEATAEPSAPDAPMTEESPAANVPETEEPSAAETPATEESDAEDTPETVESDALAALREKIKAEGKLFGVAYLGGFDGDAESAKAALFGQTYLDDLAFVKDIEPYVVQEGWQMYCIVPVDDTVSLSICEYVFEEVPCVGEELLFTNEPVLLRGNVSDIVPNLCIIATKGAERVEYCPMQSGMDGTLVDSDDLIFDFTPYTKMPEFSWLQDTTE